MIQIQTIRDKKEFVIERLAVKNFDAGKLITQIIDIDETRRTAQKELDALLSESNTLAKQVGELMRSGKKAEADELKNKSGALKESSKQLGEKLAELEKQQHDLLVTLPNLPSEKVPCGKTPTDNEVMLEEGRIPQLPESA
jgi:seryl-tRNA synthetase